MIAPRLEALREKDPETWDYIDTVLKLGFPMPGVCDPNGVIAGYIIQGSIQSAIQARGWSWRMQGFPEIDDDHPGQTCCTIMRRKGSIWDDHKTAYRASPAEALLSCYLEAIG